MAVIASVVTIGEQKAPRGLHGIRAWVYGDHCGAGEAITRTQVTGWSQYERRVDLIPFLYFRCYRFIFWSESVPSASSPMIAAVTAWHRATSAKPAPRPVL